MHRILRWLLQVSAVQLFLTLISLPILVSWGLPISYLTPVGTLLFTPILTIYLWCALAVFFSTLLYIPNGICIKLLSLISTWWLWALSLIKTPMTLGFVCPPLPLLCIIPLTSFILVFSLRNKKLWVTVCALALLLCFWMGVLRMLTGEHHINVMHTNNKKIAAFFHNNLVTVIDSESSCSSMVDGTSWVLYTVMPAITKKTGATSIDRFIVLHPRQRTFEALTALCKKGVIKDIYIPYWQGHIPRNAFYAYTKLKNTLAEHGYTIHILKTNMPLTIDNTHTLMVTNMQKKYGDATYSLFTLNSNNLTSE